MSRPAPSFKTVKSKHADKGVDAEKDVGQFLIKEWATTATREANRLLDSKAAGRTIRKAAADFEYFVEEDDCKVHGLIEVKTTEHLTRIDRSKVTQLPNMTKRNKAGGFCILLVKHSLNPTAPWRAVPVEWLNSHGDKGSWNLSSFDSYPTPGAALIELDGMFDQYIP